MQRIAFIKNLNGLRGIAILGVILYHLDNSIFHGGWLGVNLFFILSGFLVGNILVSSNEKSVKDFINFLNKRIFRILPTLLIVTLLSIPFVLTLLRPNSQIEFFKSALTAQFFVSNFYFYSLDSYVAESAKLKPLLHTWSLSLEMQFYLFFSLIFFFIKIKFRYVAYFVLLLSFLLNLLNPDQSGGFFLPQFRIFEFTLGLIINYAKDSSKISYFLNRKFQYFYLTIIVASMAIISDQHIAQITYLTPFLIATFFLITSYVQEDHRSVLQHKGIQFFGKISYSLYVVHFPVFALTNVYLSQRLIETSLIVDIFKIATSLSASIFIHYLVELRFMKNYASLTFKRALSLLFVITMFFCILLIKNNSMVFDLRGFSPNVNKAMLDGARIPQIPCWGTQSGCFINNNSKKTIFFVGDSQLASPYLEFIELPNSQNYNWFVWIKPRGVNPLAYGDSVGSSVFDSLMSVKGEKIVVYSGRLPHYLSEEKFYNGHVYSPVQNSQILSTQTLLDKINLLKLNSDHFIFIGPVPEQAWDVTNLVISTSDRDKDIYYDKYHWDIYSANFVNMISELNPLNISYIDSTKIFCMDIIPKKCVAKLGNEIYYYDDVHLTALGGRLIADRILSEIYLLNNFD